jgi:hypothetical protein
VVTTPNISLHAKCCQTSRVIVAEDRASFDGTTCRLMTRSTLRCEGTQAASWIEFTGPEGRQPGLCFFECNEAGLIARIDDFWPDPYELRAGRAHLVERY